MAEFKVTPQMLRTASGNINKINTNFTTVMESIRSEMQRMKGKWDSEAANAFINKFEALKDDFENYKQIIGSYAKFLEATAVAYETADKEINNATSHLIS